MAGKTLPRVAVVALLVLVVVLVVWIVRQRRRRRHRCLTPPAVDGKPSTVVATPTGWTLYPLPSAEEDLTSQRRRQHQHLHLYCWHGFALSATSWEPLAQTVPPDADVASVTAFDVPPWWPHAAAAAGHRDRCVFVGHSMGCIPALHAADRLHPPPAALVLVAPVFTVGSLSPLGRVAWTMLGALREVCPRPVLESLCRSRLMWQLALWWDTTNTIDDVAVKRHHAAAQAPNYMDRFAAQMSAFDGPGRDEEEGATARVRELLRRVAARGTRIVVLRGDQDPLLPPPGQDRVVDGVPLALHHAERWPDAGHLLHERSPHRVWASLRAAGVIRDER